MGAIAAAWLPGPTNGNVAHRMCAVAPHRGLQITSLAVGETTLACVTDDIDDAVVGASGGVAVAFVGSLDNRTELLTQLAERGIAPASEAVADVLLACFRAFGDELPGRLRGVFAGIIADDRSVIAFRDHLGYQPLFYRADARGFVAATEAKQVVEGAGVAKEPDLDVVTRIFYNSIDDAMPSALLGVTRLPKATAIHFDGRDTRTWRFWHPERLLETASYSETDLRDRFDQLMGQAVARSLVSPSAVSLSGGIDSPALAAFAAPEHLARFGTPLQAITVVYPKYPSVDERRYVEPLARELGLPLHLYEQQSNALGDVEQWVRLTDSPYRSAALAQYAEDYRRARALGARTVLSGEHAEFVIGMQWYQLEHFLTHGRFRSLSRQLTDRRALGRSWPSLLRLLARSAAPEWMMDVRRATQPGRISTTPTWVDPSNAPRNRRKATPVRERWRRLQLTAFIGPGISLEAEEVCQAVTGVRSRKPWTDIDLWELFLSLRAEQKFPDLRPKGLVRNLLRGRVPDFILDRRDKTVFDEAGLAEIDYGTLRRYLRDPVTRISGVDYRRLNQLLDAERLSTIDYGWARTLTTVHAFLAQWDTT